MTWNTSRASSRIHCPGISPESHVGFEICLMECLCLAFDSPLSASLAGPDRHNFRKPIRGSQALGKIHNCWPQCAAFLLSTLLAEVQQKYRHDRAATSLEYFARKDVFPDPITSDQMVQICCSEVTVSRIQDLV